MWVLSMLTDRRELERCNVSFADSVAWFSVNDRLYPTHIVNRSALGVGVTIRQQPPMEVGAFVSLEWLRPMPDIVSVVVRSISRLNEDEWYVGLEYQDRGDTRQLQVVSVDSDHSQWGRVG